MAFRPMENFDKLFLCKQDIEITKLCITCIKGAILVQFESSNSIKSIKCHNYSGYSLNDLEMTFKVIGKCPTTIF